MLLGGSSRCLCDLATIHVESVQELFDVLLLVKPYTFRCVFHLNANEYVHAGEGFDLETIAQTFFDFRPHYFVVSFNDAIVHNRKYSCLGGWVNVDAGVRNSGTETHLVKFSSQSLLEKSWALL